ncbi:MAG: hydrogenase small subunit [Bacillota bacterium]
MMGLEKLFQSEIARRDFLKYGASITALLGLSDMYVPRVARALEKLGSGKQPVIWLNGAGCTGCTVSFANSNYPQVAELVLDTISLRYHETLMAASGYVADKALEETIKKSKGKYILILEGAIPTKDNGIYCKVSGRTFTDIIKEAAGSAAYNVAMGTCASFGGIPGADPNPTGCKGLKDVVGGTVVNIPGCPGHPDWLVGTLVNILLFGKVPELDQLGRPKIFYGKLIHDNCPRRGAYEEGRFIKNIGEEAPDIEGCMGAKGCRGPVTYADCPHRLWNSGVSFCIKTSAPCAGCTEPTFPQPSLYEPIHEVAKLVKAQASDNKEAAIGTFGASLGGAIAGAAAGAGAVYFAGEKAKEQAKGKEGVK